jgi:hypothetical protein
MIIQTILNRPTTAQAYADITDYLYEAQAILAGDMVWNTDESIVAQVKSNVNGSLEVVRPNYHRDAWEIYFWDQSDVKVLEG